MDGDSPSIRIWQGLRLTQEELCAIRHTGYIIAEQRGRKVRYRLRFRIGPRLHSRCLGSDPATVAHLRAALAQLRAETEAWRAVAEILRRGARFIKQISVHFTPALEDAGYHLHGRTVRRKRLASSIQQLLRKEFP